MRELVIDSFAGGGGASEGIRMALGRDPDIAVNHDPAALAMHRVNHPGTRHMVQDVATVDSVGLCRGQPIGMLWMSPDCTDHSKAKGAAPRRDGDRTTRGIGWAIVGWVKALPRWQRPRVVFLENVEEYVDWGPLLPDGRRCPVRKGETFRAFVEAWRRLGYGAIEWRERRAWWSGSGTIRKRLFMIMRRRDGEPIVWPERTHGNPGDPADAARIAAGELAPWVTIADCIDWSLPCPSIFASAGEIRDQHGVRAVRPLAPKTLARVAMGIRRRVLDAPRPFIIKVNHTADGPRDRSASAPAGAMTSKRDDALVAPVMAYAQHGGATRPADAPVQTITASQKDQNTIVVPYLVPRYGEGPGQAPRTRSADIPAPAIVPTGNEGHIVAAFIAQHNDGPRGGMVARRADAPISTITTTGSQQALVSLPLMTVYYGSEADGASVDRPGRTETVRDRFGLVDVLAHVPPFGPEHETRARAVADLLRAHGCWDDRPFVTLTVEGVTLVLVDVGMRMLTPRERFTANGFPLDYIIDHGIGEHGERIPFSLAQQGHMCGNAVCPTEAAALVAANYRPREVAGRPVPEAHGADLFREAAE